MLPTLPLGPFIFPTAGLVIILGAWLCLWVTEKAALRLQLDAQATYTLAVVGLVAGFLGARLVFVALHWPAYQQNLIGILWPLTSGYEPLAGVVVGGLAAFFYGRARQLPFASTLDALAPGLILGFMVISLADFLGGPGYGTLTAVPWGLSQYGVRRHPVQLYELLAGAFTLLIWWQLVERRRYEGQLFLTAVAFYSATRLFLDAFRDNTWITADGYHGWQLVTFAAMLLGLLLLARHTPPDNQ
jgi:phosphatidylglycerol:prolipoprotein diacylglycerol transferase